MRLVAKRFLLAQILAVSTLAATHVVAGDYDPTAVALEGISKLKVGQQDWPQWGGSAERNNVPKTGPLPYEFDVKSGTNIRWSSPLGSETYGNQSSQTGKSMLGPTTEMVT